MIRQFSVDIGVLRVIHLVNIHEREDEIDVAAARRQEPAAFICKRSFEHRGCINQVQPEISGDFLGVYRLCGDVKHAGHFLAVCCGEAAHEQFGSLDEPEPYQRYCAAEVLQMVGVIELHAVKSDRDVLFFSPAHAEPRAVIRRYHAGKDVPGTHNIVVNEGNAFDLLF